MTTLREQLATLPERKALVRAVLQPIQRGKRDRTIQSAYNRLRPGPDGRIHTGLSVATTNARLASSKSIVEEGSTNLQNQVNKIRALDPLYDTRGCMQADPGFQLVCRDFAGAEMLLCVDARSLTLMADLTWKPLSSVRVGDQIITPTEHPKRRSREWKVATVTHVRHSMREVWRFRTPHGDLRVTPDHKVLRRYCWGWQWLEAGRLMSGKLRKSQLALAVQPWRIDDSYEAGWLGGFLDGEGYLGWSRGGFRVGASQKPGLVLAQAQSFLARLGYRSRTYHSRSASARSLYIFGERFADQMCLLGQTRPVRLLKTLREKLSANSGTPAAFFIKAPVLSVRSLGKRHTVDLTTTEGTFLADGFVVHNCFAYAEDWEWVDRMLKGESAHGVHAKEAFHLTCRPGEVKKKHPEVYTTAKNLGFLSIYSGSARTAMVTFNKDYPVHGQRVTEKEVQRFQQVLYDLHPLHAWWANVEQELEHTDGIAINCPEISTPVLCADAVWRPIGDVSPGDGVIAFDEHRNASKRGRQYRVAKVLATRHRTTDCVRVVTEHGEITITPDHFFLTRDKAGKHGIEWRRASRLSLRRDGTPHLYWITEPWASPDKPTWLGGVFDGEGYSKLAGHAGSGMVIAQVHGPVEQAIEHALLAGRYAYTGVDRPPITSNRQWARLWYIRGGLWGMIRFLGMERPVRSEQIVSTLHGSGMTGQASKVLAVEPVGRREIAEIATSTKTLVTAGFASHNCFGYQRPLRDPDKHNRLKDALAFFPSSTVAWRMNQSLVRFHDELDRAGEIELLHQNHDELDWQALPECLEESLAYTKRVMEEPFAIHGRKLHIPTDVSVSEVGGSWGSVQKLSGA